MISGIDSSVILDVLSDDPNFADGSEQMLREASNMDNSFFASVSSQRSALPWVVRNDAMISSATGRSISCPRRKIRLPVNLRWPSSSSNHTVMSPRSLRAISYAAQFFTR
jgi:hypothetical protein